MIDKNGRVFHTHIFSNEIDEERREKYLRLRAIERLVAYANEYEESIKEEEPECIVNIFKDGSISWGGDLRRIVGIEYSNPGIMKLVINSG